MGGNPVKLPVQHVDPRPGAVGSSAVGHQRQLAICRSALADRRPALVDQFKTFFQQAFGVRRQRGHAEHLRLALYDSDTMQ